MELTVKQYAEKRGINKGYISRIVRDRKLHLMSDVAKITKKTDAFGTMFYLLKMKPTKDLKVVTKDTKKKYV
jgi:hypothetical protein